MATTRIPKRRQRSPKSRASGGAASPWTIVGPETPKRTLCGAVPEFTYGLLGDKTQLPRAEILQIVWHKIPRQDAVQQGAIDRLLVDSDWEAPPKKTPHYSVLIKDGVPTPLSQDTFSFAICVMSFCSTGHYDLYVHVRWRDTQNGNIHFDTQSFAIAPT